MCVSRKEKQMSFEKVRVFVVSNLTKKMTQQKSLPFSINQLKHTANRFTVFDRENITLTENQERMKSKS